MSIMAQYESNKEYRSRSLQKNMAHFLDVSTHALTVPDIDTNIGLMHTFLCFGRYAWTENRREVDGEVVTP